MHKLAVEKIPAVVGLYLDNEVIPKFEGKSLAKFGAVFMGINVTKRAKDIANNPKIIDALDMGGYMEGGFVLLDALKEDTLEALSKSGGEIKTFMYDFDKDDIESFYTIALQHCEVSNV